MKRSVLPSLALALALHSAPAPALQGWEETASDVLTGVVPLGALYRTYAIDDADGRKQWLWSTGTALAANTALRVAFNQTHYGTRPNGHPYGFPSGHIGFIASGAAFLQERYGYRYGVPAWLATGYVAYVRVESDHHRWRDTLAGAAVAYGVSRLLVTPCESLEVSPVVESGMLGVRLRYAF